MINLTNKIKKLEDWLISLYKKKGGWPAVQIDDDIGALTTGEALRSLVLYTDFSCSVADVALQNIFNSQNRSGAWPLIRERQLDSVLSTAEIIQALIVSQKKFSAFPIAEKIKERVKKALQWLIAEQNEDGGFGYASFDRVGMDNMPNYKKSNVYATCMAVLSIICAKNHNFIIEETCEKIVKKATSYLSSCRDPITSLWRLYPTYPNTSLALSALVSYVLYVSNGTTVLETQKFLKYLGFDRKRNMVSLPIESVPLQLPDGEVAFYINGAYWCLKFFIENNIPYAGMLPFLKYINQNKEFEYFRAQCFATETPYPQVVWFSIELYELLKLVEHNDYYIEKSIVEASLYLSNVETTPLFDDCYDKLEDISTFLNLINRCTSRQEILIIDHVLHSLCELGFFDKYETSQKVQQCVLLRLSTITDFTKLEVIDDDSADGYYTKILDVNIKLLKVLQYLSHGKIKEAKHLFFTGVCYKNIEAVSYEIIDALFEVLAAISLSSSKRTLKEKILILQSLITNRFNKSVLSQILDKISNLDLNIDIKGLSDFQDNFTSIADTIRTDRAICDDTDLIGREDELTEAVNSISLGNKVLTVSGEFRVGKTSFMKCLAKMLSSNDVFLITQIDFSHELAVFPDIQQFTVLLLDKIKQSFINAGIKGFQTEKIKKIIQNIANKFSGITLAGWGINLSSQNTQRQLPAEDEALNDLNDFFSEMDRILSEQKKKLFILIDEYTRLGNINNRLGKAFDALIRGLSQNTVNIYFALAGQNITDLDSSDDTATLTTVSHLIMLQGWGADSVRYFIKTVDNNIIIPDNVMDELVDCTGGNPFWVRMILKQIIKVLNVEKSYLLSKKILLESMELLIYDADAKNKLNWNFKAVTEKTPFSEEVMRILSKVVDYTYDREAFRGELGEESFKALYALESKGTIRLEKGKYAIANRLLKMWIKEFVA